MNAIYDLLIGFEQVRYQIKGIVEYIKMVLKYLNFRLIS